MFYKSSKNRNKNEKLATFLYNLIISCSFSAWRNSLFSARANSCRSSFTDLTDSQVRRFSRKWYFQQVWISTMIDNSNNNFKVPISSTAGTYREQLWRIALDAFCSQEIQFASAQYVAFMKLNTREQEVRNEHPGLQFPVLKCLLISRIIVTDWARLIRLNSRLFFIVR